MIHRLATVRIDKAKPKILVIHRDPGRYDAFKRQNNDPEPAYIIGRSMFETDRIPDDWPSKCNREVDEIWVPSHFNVETFNKSGVMRSMLRVIPEPIDVHRYDKAFVNPLRIQREGDGEIAPPFSFLSVGKWEARKGYDILLEAFYTAFSDEDDVLLNIRAGVSEQDFERAKSEALKTALKWRALMPDGPGTGRFAEDWYPPAVEVLRDPISYARLPSLYAASDAFLLATHGEGWGLPIAEAMAMSLPVVATNWSGITEFLNDENAFPLPILEKLAESNDIPKGHRWAMPSVNYLVSAMKYLVRERAMGVEKGKAARESIVRRFSQEAVAAKVLDRVKVISNLVKVRKETKEAEEAAKAKKKKDEEDAAKEKQWKIDNLTKKIRINDDGKGGKLDSGNNGNNNNQWNNNNLGNNNRNNNYNSYSYSWRRPPPPPPVLKRQPNPATGKFSHLVDTCVSNDQGEYRYQVCFFKNVTQTSTRWNTVYVLGIYKEQESPAGVDTQIFTDGDTCGAKDRSSRVKLTCGGALEKLSEVTEPWTCAYAMTVELSPAHCAPPLKKTSTEPYSSAGSYSSGALAVALPEPPKLSGAPVVAPAPAPSAVTSSLSDSSKLTKADAADLNILVDVVKALGKHDGSQAPRPRL